MSRILDAQPDPVAFAAALQRDTIDMALLLSLDFASGIVRVANTAVPVTDGKWGHIWLGGGEWVGTSALESGLAPLREYYLGLPWELLDDTSSPTRAMARIPELIGQPAEYRQRTAAFYAQLMSDATDAHGRRLTLGHPIALDTGLMDTISVAVARDGIVLTLSVEGGLSRKGAPIHGMLTHRDQQRRYPTDNLLRYVPEVMSTSPKWTDF